MTNFKLTNADLRSAVAGEAITQYEFVKMMDDKTIDMCDATGDLIYGIAQEAASAAGAVVQVAVTGVSKLVASAAIQEGTYVGTTSAATGVTVVPGTDDGVSARCLCVEPATAASDLCGVDLSVQGGWLVLDDS